MGTGQMAREARYGMGWPLARTWGWVRGSCVVPAAVKAGEPGERTQATGAARANQPRVGSGRCCMAVGEVPVGPGALGGGGGWPLGPTGAIDVNSSRLPCNQLARLDPALAWLLCGKRVYFCLPSWAGVCRWVRRVRCGEMGRRGETRGEGPRGRAARGREPEEWSARRGVPPGCLRFEPTSCNPGQRAERDERRERGSRGI